MSSLVLILGLLGVTSEPTPAARGVTVQVAPGPYHVGQGIAVEVTLPAGDRTDQAIQPPTIPDARLVALEPIALDRGRFVLVPGRAGSLPIPPFRVTVGDRVLATPRTPITVANVPIVGRSPAFLGGVGGFEVTSAVEPSTVRLGQMLEYQITLTGPAAWGSQRGPSLAALPGALEVRSTSADRTATEPASQTFRYRLRAIEPGRVVVPPVAVAAFDPRSGRYLTRYTPSQAVSIEPPPRFDPARVDYGPSDLPTIGSDVWIVGWGSALGLGTLIGMVCWQRRAIVAWVKRRWAGRRVAWKREAMRLAATLRRPTDGRLLADEIAGRFTRVLTRATGQPLAVLTPLDAEAIVWGLTANEELADQVRRFVGRLDQVRFGFETHATAGDRGELVAEAVAIYQAIGRRAKENQSGRTRIRRG